MAWHRYFVVLALCSLSTFPAFDSHAQAPSSGVIATSELARANDAVARHDHATAIAIWTRLSDLGNEEAIMALASAYQSGTGVARDLNEADRLLRPLSNKGVAEASYKLALWEELESGTHGTPTMGAAALRDYRTAATQGHAQAAFEVGRHLLAKVDPSVWSGEGETYIGAAAERGHYSAMQMMAAFAHRDYERGGPIEEALKWYDALEAAGDPNAALNRERLKTDVPGSRGFFWKDRGRHTDAVEAFSESCETRDLAEECFEAGLYYARGEEGFLRL